MSLMMLNHGYEYENRGDNYALALLCVKTAKL